MLVSVFFVVKNTVPKYVLKKKVKGDRCLWDSRDGHSSSSSISSTLLVFRHRLKVHPYVTVVLYTFSTIKV